MEVLQSQTDMYAHTTLKKNGELDTYIDALLLSDLATNVGTGIKVHWSNEVDQTTETATITNSLSRLAKDVARAKVGDDTWN